MLVKVSKSLGTIGVKVESRFVRKMLLSGKPNSKGLAVKDKLEINPHGI